MPFRSSGRPHLPAGTRDHSVTFRIIDQGLRLLCHHLAGGDRVHIHAVVGPLVGKGSGKVTNALFRGGIGGHCDSTEVGQDRCDDYDLSTPLRQPKPASKLIEQKHGREIDFQGRVPILDREIFGQLASLNAVIDQLDIERSKLCETAIECPVEPVTVRKVSPYGDHLCSEHVL